MAGNIHSIIRKWSITQIVRNVSVTKPDMAINCLPTKSTDNCSLFHFKRSVIYQEWGMQIKIKSVYSYFIYQVNVHFSVSTILSINSSKKIQFIQNKFIDNSAFQNFHPHPKHAFNTNTKFGWGNNSRSFNLLAIWGLRLQSKHLPNFVSRNSIFQIENMSRIKYFSLLNSIIILTVKCIKQFLGKK